MKQLDKINIDFEDITLTPTGKRGNSVQISEVSCEMSQRPSFVIFVIIKGQQQTDSMVPLSYHTFFLDWIII